LSLTLVPRILSGEILWAAAMGTLMIWSLNRLVSVVVRLEKVMGSRKLGGE
jgi:hypothetical protein